MPITISITANTGEELDEMIKALTARLGGTVQYTGDTTASATVSDPAPKATKTGKKKEAPEPEAPEPEAPEPEAPTMNTVTDLSAKDARDQGIKILQAHFGANPNNMTVIHALQTKYGVKMFSDIKDEQSHAFLADAKLVQSGNFVA